MIRNKSGATLVEIVMTVMVISIAAMALGAPLMTASRATGSKWFYKRAALANLARQQAELVARDFAGLTPTQWSQQAVSLAATSPVAMPDKVMDGVTYRATRSFTCLSSDLATQDPACADGFVLVTVTITSSPDGDTYTLTFLKTAGGV
ncbi:MAG: type II secretion system protein [Nitrospinae bacterium]|nr:type II secretion system protein [Nitrospinota bacterium]